MAFTLDSLLPLLHRLLTIHTQPTTSFPQTLGCLLAPCAIHLRSKSFQLLIFVAFVLDSLLPSILRLHTTQTQPTTGSPHLSGILPVPCECQLQALHSSASTALIRAFLSMSIMDCQNHISCFLFIILPHSVRMGYQKEDRRGHYSLCRTPPTDRPTAGKSI